MAAGTHKKYDAVLIDLDGTLIDIDLERFIKAYVDALSGRFNDRIPREEFIMHLFGSTSVMVENNDPKKSNSEVFYDDFCRRIGFSKEEILPVIEDFYRHDFPGLSCWGKELPHALKVIEAARGNNHNVVLATNPIFPPAAVYHRMKWAGLNEGQFELITTMDNMHFCKPNPNYYLEIAEKINCRPERCLMAGNDTLEDLIAAEAGMETFLVEDFILERHGTEPVSNYRGSLEDLANFLSK
jgi:FMN phosphatase YigB (HAD superfamily)